MRKYLKPLILAGVLSISALAFTGCGAEEVTTPAQETPPVIASDSATEPTTDDGLSRLRTPYVGAAHATHAVVNALPMPSADWAFASIQIGENHGNFSESIAPYTLTVFYETAHDDFMTTSPQQHFPDLTPVLEENAATLFDLIENLQAVTFSFNFPIWIGSEEDERFAEYRWNISRNGEFSVFSVSPEFYEPAIDLETTQILVNGTAINAPAPFINPEHGFIMVPVAAIAEALGFVVSGEGADIVFGGGYMFIVGVDSYSSSMRGEIIEIGAPPELRNNVLFVPLHFFTESMGLPAFYDNGNIIIGRVLADGSAAMNIDVIPNESPFFFRMGDGYSWVYDYVEFDYRDFWRERDLFHFDGEGDRLIITTPAVALRELKVVKITHEDEPRVTDVIFEAGDILPSLPLVINSFFGKGTMPWSGITFIDEFDRQRYFYIVQDQSDEFPPYRLIEFTPAN